MFQAPAARPSGPSPNVDDGLTSLSWLQNLNMCMTRLGAPTPPTPPASPNHRSSSLYLSPDPASSDPRSLSRPQSTSSCNPTSRKASSSRSSHSAPMSQRTLANNDGAESAAVQAEEVIDYKSNGTTKPPYSYATLICMAMKANKNKMTLNSIYKWIRENFLYYQNADPSWQNSIRHNLSLNKCFIKIPRTKEEPGKGGFWRLDPSYAETLVDGVFKKRRPSHRTTAISVGRRKKKKDREEQTTVLLTLPPDFAVPLPAQTIAETPPSSAESYPAGSEGGQCETIELVNAVNSIGGSLHCAAGGLSYQVYGPAFADEVCVQTQGHCVMAENGDICWNAILSDADIEPFAHPVNYSCQVVQHEASDSVGTACSCDECIVGTLMSNFIP